LYIDTRTRYELRSSSFEAVAVVEVQHNELKSIIASSHIGVMLSVTGGDRYTTIHGDDDADLCTVAVPLSDVEYAGRDIS
jgi:hypothetical protein